MNFLLAITFSFFLVLPPVRYSHCNLNTQATQTKMYDTLKKFVVDDYPLSFELIDANAHSRKSGEITNPEGAWFSNDTLKQTLVFVLYTDGHRLYTFHFLNDDIPIGLMDKMELQGADDLASNKLKQKYFKGFLTQTTKIKKSYFKTDKGFRLGDSKEKALKIYGKPAKIKTENEVEMYEWEFIGDTFYNEKTDRGKPVAENSYGHQTTMFFRNNKLIGLIFHNEIP
jgi:hypothetical protein